MSFDEKRDAYQDDTDATKVSHTALLRRADGTYLTVFISFLFIYYYLLYARFVRLPERRLNVHTYPYRFICTDEPYLCKRPRFRDAKGYPSLNEVLREKVAHNSELKSVTTQGN